VTIKGASNLAAAGGAQPASVPTGALPAGTTYYYRVVAENGTAPATDGPVQSFTTVPTPSTVSVTAITGTTATFEGSLTPLNKNVATKYYFEYGQGPECPGPRTTEEEAGTGTGGFPATPAPVTGLQPDAEYTVCLVTANEFNPGEAGSQHGPAVHFDTPAAPPKIDSPGGVPILTPYEAMLEAQVNPDGQATSYKFEYSTKGTTGPTGTLEAPITTIAGSKALAAGISDQSAVVIAKNLTPGKTYYYRVVAENGTLPAAEGEVQELTTPLAEAPVIEVETVSGVTQTGAKLEAYINPDYQTTPFTFKYAKQESEVLSEHEGKTASGTLPAGSVAEILVGVSDHLASAEITGLEPDTLYYYRVMAENAKGSATQALTVATFTTGSVPTVSTGAYSAVTATTATVAGTVDPDGVSTTYYFQYGGTTGYGQQSASFPAGEGRQAGEHAAQLAGLEPGRTYHYRIVASNDGGPGGEAQSAYGQDATFETPATPPGLSGVSVSGVTQSTATVAGTVEPNGLATRWELQLGSTPGLLGDQASGNTTSTLPLSLGVGSLTPGTTYYYKLTATNADGPSAPAPEGSFTTAPGPAPAASPAAPALIPYQTIAELNAKEAKEDKKLPNPTTPLTRAQKLSKALKACHAKKGKKRASCERTARKKFGPVKKKATNKK
jgi:phosphodiesterase/alkaline phosphatase D-like protein